MSTLCLGESAEAICRGDKVAAIIAVQFQRSFGKSVKADNLNDLFHFVVSLEGITTEWDLLLTIFIAMYLIV